MHCKGTKQDMLFWPFKIQSNLIKNQDLTSFLFWSQKNVHDMLSFLLTRQVFPIFYAFGWKFPTFRSRYIPFWGYQEISIKRAMFACLFAKSCREHLEYFQIWRMVHMSYFILIYRKDWSSHINLKNLENVCFKCENLKVILHFHNFFTGYSGLLEHSTVLKGS
jgi:hypothetical protein